MGRMDGGNSSPSIMWIIPLDAMMLALSTRTPFSPKVIFPWRKKEERSVSAAGVQIWNPGMRERPTLSETETETI